jgi:hypothetical protein
MKPAAALALVVLAAACGPDEHAQHSTPRPSTPLADALDAYHGTLTRTLT